MATILPTSTSNAPLWATTISGPQPMTTIAPSVIQTGAITMRPTGQPAAPKKIFNKPIANMMRKLMGSGVKAEHLPPNVLYMKMDADLAIEAMGKFRPIHSGRPKFETMLFLNAAAAPQKTTSATSAYIYRVGAEAGIFMSHPPIPGKRKRSFRLTLTGLRVLDYWAEKNPSFRPFLEAFVPKKARDQIIIAEMDVALGLVPASIQKDLADIDKWAQKMAKQMAEEEARKADATVKSKMRDMLSKLHNNSIGWPKFKEPEYDHAEIMRMHYEAERQRLLYQQGIASPHNHVLTATTKGL